MNGWEDEWKIMGGLPMDVLIDGMNDNDILTYPCSPVSNRQEVLWEEWIALDK